MCVRVRAGDLPARKQVSAALYPTPQSLPHVINATPDVTQQLASVADLHPQDLRHTPFKSVMLTDGELDHTLGLLHLREGSNWTLYATEAVQAMLTQAFPVLPMLHHYVAKPTIQTLQLNTSYALAEGVSFEVLETGLEQPKYTSVHSGKPPQDTRGAVVGLMFTCGDKTLAYLPGVSTLSDYLFERLQDAHVVLFDGTLYRDDEMITLGLSHARARDMGHVPMMGAGPQGKGGSAHWLAELPAPIKRYIHINNTNPALDPESNARKTLLDLGLDLADDGWEITL